MNYYNEWDKKTAAWLRELVTQGLVPEGEVDERSITEVQPGDLRGFTQCHFFAGIGGFPLALDIARWPRTRPVWTGSCPCQPYSAAGKQKGNADERHLWPEMFRLARECRPDTILGEQVESAVRHGWLDGVFGDLEGEGYTCGAVVLGAHSVGAPHIRQRLYWVADGGISTSERHAGSISGAQAKISSERQQYGDLRFGHSDGGADGGIRDAFQSRLEGHAGHGADGREPGRDGAVARGPAAEAVCAGGRLQHAKSNGRYQRDESGMEFTSIGRFWRDFDILPFRDGKARRVEPGTFPLAHGVPARVGRLRGYGNAIVPQVAAEFIMAYMDAAND